MSSPQGHCLLQIPSPIAALLPPSPKRRLAQQKTRGNAPTRTTNSARNRSLDKILPFSLIRCSPSAKISGLTKYMGQRWVHPPIQFLPPTDKTNLAIFFASR
ncbi:uncharacterized protein EI90DRAFT_3014299 [Cantharellus anzutake]|uniref:uncharacterized protein n=1 Tax=Cantharellus anzutake TaxID=1750568 RepID=UPI00190891F0|nr:uncharacterized protein EI90DRAFT_3014299 [Cantharellus anzutake]KAF8336608.1 hypothetical protein EI90DRAFT_3014299 [Cantharellus anzutake]